MSPRRQKPATAGKTAAPRVLEGFRRALSVPEGEVPRCSSMFYSFHCAITDFRGRLPGATPAHGLLTSSEWETAAPTSRRTTTFTWIGGSQLRPAMRASFPYVSATLSVDGGTKLPFPLGRPTGWTAAENDLVLRFEPRRFLSMVEGPHRAWSPDGVSGFYHLTVPGHYLSPGKPLRLRVDLPPAQPGVEVFFYVSPRRDALQCELPSLQAEVAQLQSDLLELTQSHEMLYAQVYPALFPRRLPGDFNLALQEDTRHLHPASVTVLHDDEIVITCREATDHLATDGRIVIVRSRDHGRTWGPKEVLFDLGNVDHRGSPIVELPNGEWVTTDYRVGTGYTEAGLWDLPARPGPTLWGAWSTDRGKTWNFSAKPLTVPDAPVPYAEVERHMIRLPSGRLLVGANFCHYGADGKTVDYRTYRIAVFASDDNGRHWELLSAVPYCPCITGGEISLLQMQNGSLTMLARSEAGSGANWLRGGMLYQSDSTDDGRTWSAFRPTPLSSMSSPAHLIRLQDGRILCTHASRAYPGSVYVTVSHDQGKTWDTAGTRIVTNDLQNFDSCYPTSGQLTDGTIITVWYANLFGRFYIGTLRYRPEDL